MDDFLAALGVLHRQVVSGGINPRHVHTPALFRVGEGFLQFDELGEVGVVERVGLAHVAAGVELVVPDLVRGGALVEEQHHGLDAGALEGAAGAVEDGVEVATLEQQLAQAHRCVVGVRQEGVLDDDGGPAAGLEHLDEVLQEQEGGFAGADGEVLLHLGAFLAAEGWVGEDHVHPVLVLDVGEVLGQGVGVDDVGRLDAVQDHVHDRNHVGEALLLLAVESALLKDLQIGGAEIGLGGEVVVGFAQKTGRATGSVVDRPSHRLRRRCARRSAGRPPGSWRG